MTPTADNWKQSNVHRVFETTLVMMMQRAAEFDIWSFWCSISVGMATASSSRRHVTFSYAVLSLHVVEQQ